MDSKSTHPAFHPSQHSKFMIRDGYDVPQRSPARSALGEDFPSSPVESEFNRYTTMSVYSQVTETREYIVMHPSSSASLTSLSPRRERFFEADDDAPPVPTKPPHLTLTRSNTTGGGTMRLQVRNKTSVSSSKTNLSHATTLDATTRTTITAASASTTSLPSSGSVYANATMTNAQKSSSSLRSWASDRPPRPRHPPNRSSSVSEKSERRRVVLTASSVPCTNGHRAPPGQVVGHKSSSASTSSSCSSSSDGRKRAVSFHQSCDERTVFVADMTSAPPVPPLPNPILLHRPVTSARPNAGSHPNKDRPHTRSIHDELVRRSGHNRQRYNSNGARLMNDPTVPGCQADCCRCSPSPPVSAPCPSRSHTADSQLADALSKLSTNNAVDQPNSAPVVINQTYNIRVEGPLILTPEFSKQVAELGGGKVVFQCDRSTQSEYVTVFPSQEELEEQQRGRTWSMNTSVLEAQHGAGEGKLTKFLGKLNPMKGKGKSEFQL